MKKVFFDIAEKPGKHFYLVGVRKGKYGEKGIKMKIHSFEYFQVGKYA